MNKITAYSLTGTIAADGTITATTNNPIHGFLEAVEINYPAATCTVDLDATSGVKGQKLMDLAASNTDIVIYPRVQLQDNTGTALDLSDAQGGDTKAYGRFPIAGLVTMSVAAGTATQSVTVRFIVEEY